MWPLYRHVLFSWTSDIVFLFAESHRQAQLMLQLSSAPKRKCYMYSLTTGILLCSPSGRLSLLLFYFYFYFFLIITAHTDSLEVRHVLQRRTPPEGVLGKIASMQIGTSRNGPLGCGRLSALVKWGRLMCNCPTPPLPQVGETV